MRKIYSGLNSIMILKIPILPTRSCAGPVSVAVWWVLLSAGRLHQQAGQLGLHLLPRPLAWYRPRLFAMGKLSTPQFI